MITDQGTPYACSACDSTVLLAPGVLDVPMHPCVGRGGMAVPYTPAGVRSKVELNTRQDYVGGEDVQRDDEGRVWMSVTVTTDEYEHVAAYAPCAHASIGG